MHRTEAAVWDCGLWSIAGMGEEDLVLWPRHLFLVPPE
jgi:hypothetical protein